MFAYTARETYTILGNGTLWQAVSISHQILSVANVPHALMGGVAVCLHGYRRNTADVNWLARKQDWKAIDESLVREGYFQEANRKKFRSPLDVSSDSYSQGMRLVLSVN
jgi:hypothetical protein